MVLDGVDQEADDGKNNEENDDDKSDGDISFNHCDDVIDCAFLKTEWW